MNWKIKYYLSGTGHSEVLKRYEEGSEKVQAAFEVHLDYLIVRPQADWQRPKVAKLSRDVPYKDFYEMRFFADQIQQRPIGFFGPGKNDFTIVIWAIEKDRKFIPKDWNKIANNRRKDILDKKATAVDFDF